MTNNTPQRAPMVARQYIIAFVLVTSLFFMWGGARAILDVLNKHFQDALNINKTQSSLIQVAVYLAYFLGALPAGMMIRKIGTRVGIIVGLLLFATGSLLFIPASSMAMFWMFLLPLFIMGCGLVILETAANPYVTLLGDPSTAAGRLNLSQSFNGLGCMIGVLFGGQMLLSDGSAGSQGTNIAIPYAVIGIIVLAIALCFTRVKLPEVILEDKTDNNSSSIAKPLGFTFFFGLAALLAYEISEISINTFFINYLSDDGFMSAKDAATLLSLGCLGLFMLGRVIGSKLMQIFSTEIIYFICACGAIVTTALVIMPFGALSKYALVACYAFESIMFPTIFALSIRGLGANTERASSILMMSVVGGALGPLALGWVADHYSITQAFAIPLATFVVVWAFAFHMLIKSRKQK